MVIETPVTLSGVSSSPKNHAEALIVVTSFAIPAIDMGTMPARCRMLVADRDVRLALHTLPAFTAVKGDLLKFTQDHAECNDTGRYQEEGRSQELRAVLEEFVGEYFVRPIHDECEDGQCQAHDRCEPEQRCGRVVKSHFSTPE